MAMKKKPVTGMKDILPREMEIRDYAIGLIKETYKKFGFTSVETPCVEHIENLSSKQGGENEKLIFKILKRGEKLRLEDAQSAADLVDGGLRYDLTVPLCRFYSNNSNELPSPFKALQMGNVWRADRPQKGRYRQFMQCDIDILGEPTNLAEIELILATSTLLGKLDFNNFTIRINDRRILRAMVDYAGFVPVAAPAAEDGEAESKAADTVDYDGIFSVEFMIAQDKAYFLEINLRNDGTQFCFEGAGVNLPFLWVESERDEDISHLQQILKEQMSQ